ncbi:hypothetical protein D3C80_774540 [compost metagenome]
MKDRLRVKKDAVLDVWYVEERQFSYDYKLRWIIIKICDSRKEADDFVHSSQQEPD